MTSSRPREVSGDEMTRGTTARPAEQKTPQQRAAEAREAKNTQDKADGVAEEPKQFEDGPDDQVPVDTSVKSVVDVQAEQARAFESNAMSQNPDPSLVEEMMSDAERSLEEAWAAEDSPKGRLSEGTKVWYAMDQDGIVEFLPARVITAEPRPGGFQLATPVLPDAVHLAVKMSPRHNANLPEVTRTDVGPAPDEGKIEAGFYYRTKPAGADEQYKMLMERRGIREEQTRDAARSAAGARRVAAERD